MDVATSVATESSESCVDLVSITSTLLSALSADGHLECWDVCHGGRWQEICCDASMTVSKSVHLKRIYGCCFMHDLEWRIHFPEFFWLLCTVILDQGCLPTLHCRDMKRCAEKIHASNCK